MSAQSFSPKYMSPYFHQFATLYKSGLPLTTALNTLAQSAGHPKLRKASENARRLVESGKSLSEAFQKQGGMFSDLQLSLIHAGEEGGFLDNILEKLAEQAQWDLRLRRSLVKEFSYPVFLLIAALLILPVPKIFMSGWSAYLSTALIPLLVGVCVIVGAYFLHRTLYRLPGYSDIIDLVKISIPIMGDIVKNLAWIRFCRTFELAFSYGLDIIRTMELSHDAVGNAVLRKRLRRAIHMIRKGSTLGKALHEVPGFPVFAESMIVSGEESGNIDNMMKKSADYLEEQNEMKIRTAVKVVGVLVFLLVAAGIAYVVITFWTNLYSSLHIP